MSALINSLKRFDKWIDGLSDRQFWVGGYLIGSAFAFAAFAVWYLHNVL